MEFKHDQPSIHGFDVPPEQLAHELTMLKLSKIDVPLTDDWKLYELYI